MTAPAPTPAVEPTPAGETPSPPTPGSSPTPGSEPEPTPGSSPTPATEPTPSPPTGGEICVKVDFSETAGGIPLDGGDDVEDEWEAYGLTLSAAGGLGSLPRLFDTSSVGNDPDLGSSKRKVYSVWSW